MKLRVLYFSGTGNTAYVGRYLADRLAQQPVHVKLQAIEQQPPSQIDDFDLLMMGFPVYACDAPKFYQVYLDNLPPGQGRGAFVFCTKGAYAGGAVRRGLQRLASQGYVPLGGGSVLMPGTDGLSMISEDSWLARKALEKDYDRLEDADRLIDRFAAILSDLSSGRRPEDLRLPLPVRPRHGLTDRTWAWLYELTEDYARARLHADSRCQGCGLCARICPVGAIQIEDNPPTFGDSCSLCLRCLHNCPQRAIQIGRLTVGKVRWHGPRGDFQPPRLREG
jgi:ferredoxin